MKYRFETRFVVLDKCGHPDCDRDATGIVVIGYQSVGPEPDAPPGKDPQPMRLAVAQLCDEHGESDGVTLATDARVINGMIQQDLEWREQDDLPPAR